MEEIDKIAYAEVMQVLKYFDRNYVMKIPIELLEYFKEHSKKDIIVNIDKDDIFNKNNISKEALELLAYIDLKYWANEEEKKDLINIYRNNELKKNEEKRIIYNSNVFSKNDLTNIETEHKQNLFENKDMNENHNLPIEYKESIFRRIINKIIHFLNKKTK